MARFLNCVRMSLLLFPQHHHHCHPRILPAPSTAHIHSQRTMSQIAEMRRSAFQENLLRILRTEINYEIELRHPREPVKEFGTFTVDNRSGKHYIQLRKKHNEKEDIKVDATMFDGFTSSSPHDSGSDVKLHISLVVDISKGEGDNVLQFICSAWPDTLGIQKVFLYQQNPAPTRPFMGPDFKEMDEELQEALLEYLQERGINDDLAAFLHDYVANKDVCEHVRWMGNIKEYLEN